MAYGQIRNGTPLYMDTTNNRLGINTSTPAGALDIQTLNTGVGANGTTISQFSNNAGELPEVNLRKSRGTTLGTNTIVQSGDYLGAIRFWGANGTGYNQTALITAVVDGTPGATNDMPSRLEFYTTPDGSGSPSERMRISSSGNVGIGVTSPDAQLKVRCVTAGQNAAFFQNGYAGDAGVPACSVSKFDNNSTTANIFVRFAINDAGTGSGQINANGANACAFGTFSDSRLKENIVDLPSQLNAIKSLRPVEFDFKDGSGHQIGFIAQEVQAVYPDLVGVGADDMFTLTDLNKNDARLIKAFQEMCAKVEALEARVAELEK
jgi:hypothetical protein